MSGSPLSSLEGGAIHGAFWTATEPVGPYAVQFVISIVGPRLSPPRQPGDLSRECRIRRGTPDRTAQLPRAGLTEQVPGCGMTLVLT
jgi:hypothetical protein